MFSFAPILHFANRCSLARLFIVALVLSFAACGGGGGGSSNSNNSASVDSTPSISNLQFSSTSALQNDNNGALEVTVTFDYADSGKDLSTIYLKYPDGSSGSEPIDGVQGTASGSIEGTFIIDTSVLGSFNFEFYVTDAKGLRSNTLTGSFVVNPNDSASVWSTQSFPVTPGILLWQKRVRWFGSLYVTVGETIFTSPDAVTWTEHSPGLSTMTNDVTWTGSQFIVVGDNGVILTSPNASTWAPQNIPQGLSSPTLSGVASSGSRVVAVGSQLDVSGTPTLKGLILTSSDGVTWIALPGTIPGTLNAVVWTGSQFVAVGTAYAPSTRQALVYTSSDGLNWTSTVLSQTGEFYDVAWSGTRFVATGYGGAATSTDGFAWQQTGFGLSGVAGNAIAWSGQHFLVCSVAYCALTADGLTWSSIQQSMGQISDVRGIAWDGTKWIFVGSDSYVATSP